MYSCNLKIIASQGFLVLLFCYCSVWTCVVAYVYFNLM